MPPLPWRAGEQRRIAVAFASNPVWCVYAQTLRVRVRILNFGGHRQLTPARLDALIAPYFDQFEALIKLSF